MSDAKDDCQTQIFKSDLDGHQTEDAGDVLLPPHNHKLTTSCPIVHQRARSSRLLHHPLRPRSESFPSGPQSLPHMVVDGFIVIWRAAEVGCQVLALVGDLTTSSCSTCAQTYTLFDHSDVTRGSILQVKCAIAFDLTGRCEWCYLCPLLLTWFNCIPITGK